MKNLLKKKNIKFEPKKLENGYSGYILYSKCKIDDIFDKNKKSLYEHFKYIYDNCKDFSNIKEENETYTYRYNYYLEYNKNAKNNATIIMANPAFAYSKKLDTTISNIITFFKAYKKLEIKSFDIVNLYPVRMPKLDCLSCFNSFLDFEEEKYHGLLKEYLEQKSNSGSILIAAWGKDYNVKAKEIFEDCLIKFKAFQKTKDGAPVHFAIYNKYKTTINNLIKNNKYQMPDLDV